VYLEIYLVKKANRHILFKIVFRVQCFITELKFKTPIIVTHSTPNVQQSNAHFSTFLML